MQQPFWATLASTKVNVYKNDEAANAAVDGKLSESTDASDLGSVDFSKLLEKVWVMEVGSTEISFRVWCTIDDVRLPYRLSLIYCS